MLRTTHLTLVLAAFAIASAPVSPQLFAQNSTSEATVSSSQPEADVSAVKKVATAATAAMTALEFSAQRERLFLENQWHDEALRQELAPATAELQRLKVNADLVRAQGEKELLERKTAIDQARLEAEEISAQASLETARLQKSMQSEMITLRVARDRANIEADLAQAHFLQQNSTFRAQEIAWNARLAELSAKVAEREKEEQVEAYVEQKCAYTKEPLQADGTLLISDRRIPLNGVITMETAETVCARIDYFNNKNKEYPIFIVIDDSPGGSVMAGYKILKTMQSSSAPVYVVVKSFAASMAAAICTLAQDSYAYPNAIILHHQISNGSRGNLTSQRESVKMLGEWWRRLAEPIAAKMGISVDDFRQQMYTHSASGDWQEFADEACKLKWVNKVVGHCRETAQIRNPNLEANAGANTASAGDQQASAAPRSRTAPTALPRLNPVDCYYLYNPDGYYRAE